MPDPPPAAGWQGNPAKGTVDAPAYDCTLVNDDKVAETFQYQAARPVANLTAQINDTQTTVPTDDSTLGGQVVHIGREAIELGSYDAGNSEYTGCTRGVFDSDAIYHASGDGIYDEIPFWRGRKGDLVYVYDDGSTTTERVEWTGIVTDIATDATGTRCTISMTHVISAIYDVQINRDAQPVPQQDHRFRVSPNSSSNLAGYVQVSKAVGPKTTFNSGAGGSGYQTQVFKRDWWSSQAQNKHAIALQVHNALLFTPVPGSNRNPALGSQLEDTPETTQTNPIPDATEPVYELICYGQKIKQVTDKLGQGTTNAGLVDGDVRPTQEEPYPDHPITIAETHAVSTTWDNVVSGADDCVHIQQSLDITDLVENGSENPVTTTDRLTAKTAPMKVDHLIMGWDGKSVDYWNRITSMLRSFGLFWGTNGAGALQIRRYGLAGVRDYDDAADEPLTALQDRQNKQLKWSNALKSAVDKIVCKVGGLPWREPDTITVQESGTVWDGDQSPRRPGVLAAGSEWEYDYNFMSASPDGKDRVEGIAIGLLNKHSVALPKISIRVRADDFSNEQVGIGERVIIENLGLASGEKFIVSGGSRISVDGTDSSLLALVTGKTFEPGRFTFKLTLRYLNFRAGDFVRWRAPTLEVDSNTNTGSDDKLYVTSNSQFSFDAPDNESFYVGDEVNITDRTFAKSQGAFQIDGIGSDGTGDYIQIDNSSSIGNVANQFVRLAPYDTYDNPKPGTFSNVDLIWTYLADASENLGSANDDAHIYGV